MNIVIPLVSFLAALVALVWLGFRVRPKPFPAFAQKSPELKTMPLPQGLPGSVERFYRAVYGDSVPVVETVVISARGVIRPFMNIPLQARAVIVHNAGKDYRHYFEATIFGIPFLKVNEGYIDGESFFESPMGTYVDDPNTNQGANLAVWSEGGWFPAIWVTDPRVRWTEVDDNTALLVVPFEDQLETFVVRFNPQSGLFDLMEAMRYRNPGDKEKILWIVGGAVGNAPKQVATAMWLDQGRPWLELTLDHMVFNVDVSQYIRQRGQ